MVSGNTEFEDSIASPDATIRQGLEILVRSSNQILLVVDEELKLLGTVTDGDVRRALLKGVCLDHLLSDIMNQAPTSVSPDTSRESCIRLMKEKKHRHLPILDVNRRLLGLFDRSAFENLSSKDNWVVILAGGRGTRLWPLTKTTPKPMLPIAGKPILTHILESIVRQGFTNIAIAINYLGEQIEKEYGDGSSIGARIEYLRESKPLGTAGPLVSFKSRTSEPFIVMNGDIITEANLSSLLAFHLEHASEATMVVKQYDLQVPYGVIEAEGSHLSRFMEKPSYSFLINGGIYVIEPQILTELSPETPLDMPALFELLRAKDGSVSLYPLREYWADLGTPPDLERASSDLRSVSMRSPHPKD